MDANAGKKENYFVIKKWVWILVLGVTAARGGAVEALLTAEGFAVPQRGYRFSFPRDHGSHPEFKLEWWYITGHLFAEDGRRFGYQATFFRSARRTNAGSFIWRTWRCSMCAAGSFFTKSG
jgi:predicted secreted hydrolase